MAESEVTTNPENKPQAPPKKRNPKKRGIPQKDREYFASVPPEEFQPEIAELYLNMLGTLNDLSKAVIRLQKFAANADKSAKKILPEINSRLSVLEQAIFTLLAKKPLTREENRELPQEFSIDFDDMERQFAEMAREGTIQ